MSLKKNFFFEPGVPFNFSPDKEVKINQLENFVSSLYEIFNF